MSVSVPYRKRSLIDRPGRAHGDKRRFSGYNDDQKRILEAFDSQIQDNINYLFFLPAGAETSGVAGYNPFGYNFGFIYDGANMRTVAHELGHGIGSLRHPFDETVAVKGQTDNLMDYNDRESLWHFQWDMMQKPPKRIFKWRFEEGDAELKTGEELIIDIIEKLRCALASNRNSIFIGSASRSISGVFDYNGIKKYVHIFLSEEKERYSNYSVKKYTKNIVGGHTNFVFSEDIYIQISNIDAVDFEKHLTNSYFNIEYFKLSEELKNNHISEAIDILYNYPDCIYEMLTADECKKLLCKLSLKFNLSENYEEIVLNLLRIVYEKGSKHMQKEVLSYVFSEVVSENFLNGTKNTLFMNLYSGMDNWGGKANFSEFITLLCKMYINVYSEQLKYNSSKLLMRVSMQPDRDVKLVNGLFNFGKLWYNGLTQSKWDRSWVDGSYVDAAPLDIINLYDFGSYRSLISDISELFPVDSNYSPYIPMPAFFVAYLLNKKNSAEDKQMLTDCIRLFTLNGILLPVEDAYILLTGEDFDGVKSSRLVAGGMVVLRMFQMGKVLKLAKGLDKSNSIVVKTITKQGVKYELQNETEESIKKFIYGASQEVVDRLSSKIVQRLAINKPTTLNDIIAEVTGEELPHTDFWLDVATAGYNNAKITNKKANVIIGGLQGINIDPWLDFVRYDLKRGIIEIDVSSQAKQKVKTLILQSVNEFAMSVLSGVYNSDSDNSLMDFIASGYIDSVFKMISDVIDNLIGGAEVAKNKFDDKITFIIP